MLNFPRHKKCFKRLNTGIIFNVTKV
ncbi:hypothetical protein ACFQ1V_03100 [Virgibacillus natechei]